MVALVIFAIALGYFALAIWGVTTASTMARAKGLSRGKRVLIGAAVGLAFYLVPFWDLLPTVVLFRHYCATEAAFQVYKTVEQWKAENSDALPTLRHDPRAQTIQVGDFRRYPLNQRVVTESRTVERFLSIEMQEGRLVDLRTGAVLATFVDFRSGPKGSGVIWRSWLQESGCAGVDTGRSPISLYASLENEYEFGKSRQYRFGEKQ